MTTGLKGNVGMLSVLSLFLCCFLLGFANSLDYEREAEGPCLHTDVSVTPNLNTTWFENTYFPYFPAGSKYHLYRLASPRATATSTEQNIPEYKFYYEACLKSTIDAIDGTTNVLSFGDGGTTIMRTQFRVYVNTPGLMNLTEVTTRETTRDMDTVRQVATLTDNKSFVFFSNCWLKADQRSWVVMSTKRELGEEEVAMIEEHAIQMGFDKEHFAFMKCWKWQDDKS